MQILDTKLKNFVSLCGTHKCFEVENFTKKQLTDKDCHYLRYCLMRFIYNNQSVIYEFMEDEFLDHVEGTNRQKCIYFDVDEEASICENSLYIGSFDGYEFEENWVLKCLEMTAENRVILNIYNNENEQYKYYLID